MDTIQKLHDQIKEIIATPSDESYAYRIAQALNQAEKETIQHHNQHTFKFLVKS